MSGTRTKLILGLLLAALPLASRAQVDPMHRNLLQLGADAPLSGFGPQGIYAYYYYNNPELSGTNVALRMAIAPAYFDGEIGFKELLSPNTDVGLGIYGGAFGDNYYEVRQGHFYQQESFDGYGGGGAISLYQLLNPGQLIPLNVVLRGGTRYQSFGDADQTAPAFVLPEARFTTFFRAGLRLAGKEPVLDPRLGMELSVWFERQWRTDAEPYGFSNDRRTQPQSDLYWLYAGLSYTWTNTGHRFSLATTLGGSSEVDRFSAWRLGGVLPLSSEYPLMIPGYYYEELTARRVAHFYASYMIPLDPDHTFQLRLEIASAGMDYLPGFAERDRWQTGAGGGLSYSPKNQSFRIVVRYGYGISAQRKDQFGAQSVGVLFQYDFEQRRQHARDHQ